MEKTPAGKTAFTFQFSLIGLLILLVMLTAASICFICSIGLNGIFSSFAAAPLTPASWPVILQKIRQECLFVIIAVSIAVGVLYILLGFHLARIINRIFEHLVHGLHKLKNLDLSGGSSPEIRIKEIRKMHQTIEDLRIGLKSFRKYVPADLVTELMSGSKEAELGVEKRDMTIYFSDIAGFTPLSEKLRPEELVEELSIYFDGMTQMIIAHKGTIDKYIGDSIMAFWGAPSNLESHAVWACQAALRCQRYVYGLSREWIKRGLPPLKTRVGLHTGEVLVGNIGYSDRLNYTVIGDNVNIASRLEGLNRYYETEILISGSTYQKAKEEIETRLIDVVVVKGRTQGVPVYELAAEKNSLDSKWADFYGNFNEAMRLYLSREWDKAGEELARAARISPNDKPLQIIRDRCTAYKKNPPPQDWQGVVVMQKK